MAQTLKAHLVTAKSQWVNSILYKEKIPEYEEQCTIKKLNCWCQMNVNMNNHKDIAIQCNKFIINKKKIFGQKLPIKLLMN
jgi:hypothetical protein